MTYAKQGTECGYDAETCASKQATCTTYARSMTEAKVQEMATAFTACTGSLETMSMLNVEMLTSTMLTSFNRCGVATSLTPPAITSCYGAMSKMSMTSDCGYEGAYTCSARMCIANAASASDSMVADMMTGLATCTGDYASYGSIFTAETLTSMFLSTFNACGLTTSLTPVPIASCYGAMSKMGMASSGCGYEGSYTCSARACTANAASASDSMVADIMTGLAMCNGTSYGSFSSYYTAELVTSTFLSTFNACGLTTSLTPVPLTSCAGAVAKMGELSSACGSSDEYLTCGASKCTKFAASVTDSMVADMATGIATCTGAYAAYSSVYTLETMSSVFLSTFDSCGFTTSLTPPALTSCAGAAQKVSQLNSACGSSDDGLTSCGENKCTRFAASVTDSAMKEMATGLATCTGVYAAYSAYDPAVLIIPRLDECGLKTSASRPRLNTCIGAALLLSQREHCGSASARTCSTTCSAFVSSVTAAAVQELATGFAACAMEASHGGAFAMYDPEPNLKPNPKPIPKPYPKP